MNSNGNALLSCSAVPLVAPGEHVGIGSGRTLPFIGPTALNSHASSAMTFQPARHAKINIQVEGSSDEGFMIETIEAPYRTFQPLFFGALATLAGQGFVVPPTDGLDLIHDFFLEAWEGLMARYDPEKGRKESYVYGAFIRFARPRIVRLQRFQSGLLDDRSDNSQLLSDHGADSASIQMKYDVNLLRNGIEKLPAFERAIVLDYLQSDPPSERGLADKYSLSRYRIKEVLISALGRLIITLNLPMHVPKQDWEVARTIWQEQRTAPETAALLGITEHHVRLSHHRNIRAMRCLLANYKSFHNTQARRTVMIPRTHVNPIELFKRAVQSEHDKALLEAVRQHAREIIEAFESEAQVDLELSIKDLDPGWMSEVYAALSTVDVQELTEDAASVQALIVATEKSESSIGYALRDALMPALPTALTDFSRWFGMLDIVENAEKEDLMQTASVRAGSPYTEQLCIWGITPLTIFYATEAISMLVHRLFDYGVLDRSRPVLLFDSGVTRMDEQFIRPEMAKREILDVAECSEATAKSLFAWLIEAGRYRPFIFKGLQTLPDPSGLKLRCADQLYENVYQRWGLSAKKAAAAGRSDWFERPANLTGASN